MEIKANNPALKSWIEVKPDSDFPIQNIPFGIYSDKPVTHHACIAIGDQVMDLHEAHQLNYFKGINLPPDIFSKEYLNDFISLGKEVTRALRNRISDLLNINNNELQSGSDKEKIFKQQNAVQMLIPVRIGDYTDFYSSIDHATNVGKMFRDPENGFRA
jgi:fumarylacetoacetase